MENKDVFPIHTLQALRSRLSSLESQLPDVRSEIQTCCNNKPGNDVICIFHAYIPHVYLLAELSLKFIVSASWSAN